MLKESMFLLHQEVDKESYKFRIITLKSTDNIRADQIGSRTRSREFEDFLPA